MHSQQPAHEQSDEQFADTVLAHHADETAFAQSLVLSDLDCERDREAKPFLLPPSPPGPDTTSGYALFVMRR